MNNLNGLIPIFYAALATVRRELVGFIPATSRNSSAQQAATGQTIRVPVAPASKNQDITPGKPPENGGHNFGYVDLMITKNRIAEPIVWNGDEQISVGSMLNPMMVDQYAQAMRGLVNEVERDVCLEATIGAAKAGNVYGVAGSPLFASGLGDLAEVRKRQDDLGVALSDRHLVINTSTGMAIRKLVQLTNVNQAGDTSLLRQGVLQDLFGYAIRESGGFQQINPGTEASTLTLTANAPKDAKSIAVSTLTGTLNIGAILVIAGKHYTLTAPAIAGATTLQISPAIVDDVASGASITILSSYLPNIAFTRDFIYLLTRNPALPSQGKSGGTLLDVISITDPISGLSFQVCLFDRYRQIAIEIGLAWGQAVCNSSSGLLLLS